MGMAIDLIDRDIYNFEPFISKGDQQLSGKELQDKMEKLKLEMFDERDLYLLSDSNTWVDPQRAALKNSQAASNQLPTKLPASHRLVHRKGVWGRNMKDQLAVRAIEETLPEELQPVMTTANKLTKASLKEKAINQIERRFKQSQAIKVGVIKSKEQPNVTALKVFEFVPMLQMLGNKFTLTVCDDILEDELAGVKEEGHPMNNDFLLQDLKPEELEDHLKDERRTVLYRYTNSAKLPEDDLDAILGKKRRAVDPNSELERAILLEYVRDYVIQDKDSLAMNYEVESKIPYQSTDFIVASRKK